MKHQEVSVDYWTMLKTMFTYGALAALCWIMLRLFHTVFTLPRRLRSQQESIQNTLKDLQGRYPDLNLTEEDLVEAEKEFEEFAMECEAKAGSSTENSNQKYNIPEIVEPTEETEETKKDN
ncbi:uncharacterized protein LOC120626492 [Pararge aegeria]|uniref:Jg16254 protein n=1 Tax=Pararge aegeria aegeria TaxID=348720 RepID=A0A8S4RWF9_9NEOP|nr:uncharacterized protein LOC120626492 [Pararge aegeria]CAH2241865.1 jg16254 [Pararge aegeria aegeria]